MENDNELNTTRNIYAKGQQIINGKESETNENATMKNWNPKEDELKNHNELRNDNNLEIYTEEIFKERQ